MSDNPRMQTGELLAAAGVPPQFRLQVAYQLLVAKYAALVEAATGELGHPIEITLERVTEISEQNRATDPRDVVMVKEEPADPEPPCDRFLVSLASPDEIRAENHRIALKRMGARRN